MADLKDYSGDVHAPRLRHTDFSKEALLNWMKAAFGLLYLMNDSWIEAVTKRRGTEEAVECSREAWMKVMPREVDGLLKAQNISGNDVAAAIKLWQLCPFASLIT